MAEIFWITAEKILSLLCFFALGFLIARRRILPDDAPQTLSKLLMTLFCPALTLNGLASELNRAAIRDNAGLLLTSALLIAAAIAVSRVLSRMLAGGDRELRAILHYNLLYSNYGYIGYPMILGLFGEAALSRFLLFVVPVSLTCYTYGRMAVEDDGRLTFSFLLKPLSVAMLLGLLIGVLEIPLPGVIADVLSASGSCTGPVSMLVSGMVLSRVDLRACLADRRNYLFALLRLAVLPLFFVLCMLPLGVRGEALFFMGCFLCLPFGNNPIVFREARGMDTQKAAGMTLVSYLFSPVTVPALFALFRQLAGLA